MAVRIMLSDRTIRVRSSPIADAWDVVRVCQAEERFWRRQGEAFAAVAEVAAAVTATAEVRFLAIAGLPTAEEVAS